VVNDKDEPAAVVCFRIVQTYWNADYHGEGVGIFVNDKYRGKGLSRQLYNEAIAWCESFDRVKGTRLQTSAGLHLNFTSLFKKLLFQQIGWVYWKPSPNYTKGE
jgi:GNAT superfamily N-acetyltransferase